MRSKEFVTKGSGKIKEDIDSHWLGKNKVLNGDMLESRS